MPTLVGSYLIYTNVENTGCNPAASGFGTVTCANSGQAVLGAMLGVAFAAQGISQIRTVVETFTACVVAAYPAIQVMRRKVGTPPETISFDNDDNETRKEMSFDPESCANESRQFSPNIELMPNLRLGKAIPTERLTKRVL
jgi:hypothetical protein